MATELGTRLLMMEGRLLHVLNWANALQSMGEAGNLIQPGAVLVIGNALDTLAGELRDDWEAVREADPGKPNGGS